MTSRSDSLDFRRDVLRRITTTSRTTDLLALYRQLDGLEGTTADMQLALDFLKEEALTTMLPIFGRAFIMARHAAIEAEEAREEERAQQEDLYGAQANVEGVAGNDGEAADDESFDDDEDIDGTNPINAEPLTIDAAYPLRVMFEDECYAQASAESGDIWVRGRAAPIRLDSDEAQELVIEFGKFIADVHAVELDGIDDDPNILVFYDANRGAIDAAIQLLESQRAHETVLSTDPDQQKRLQALRHATDEDELVHLFVTVRDELTDYESPLYLEAQREAALQSSFLRLRTDILRRVDDRRDAFVFGLTVAESLTLRYETSRQSALRDFESFLESVRHLAEYPVADESEAFHHVMSERVEQKTRLDHFLTSLAPVPLVLPPTAIVKRAPAGP